MVLVHAHQAGHQGHGQHEAACREHDVGQVTSNLVRLVAMETVLVTITPDLLTHAQVEAGVALVVDHHPVHAELAVLAHDLVLLVT